MRFLILILGRTDEFRIRGWSNQQRPTLKERPMTDPKTHTLEVPGAVLHYDVREAAESGTHPTLLLIGSPMDASGFGSLAARVTDRTVVTYDPRGIARSPRTDGA